MIRYIDRIDSETHSLEISFVGMEWEDNRKRVDRNASVAVRLLERKPHINNEIVPYVEKWAKDFSKVFVPTGVWNGMKLGLLFDEKCFVALGESICELSLTNGNLIWKMDYANTPINIITPALDNKGIYVLYSGYQFVGKTIKSDLIKIGFSGDLIWDAKTRQVGDSFTAIRVRDKSLFANTWDGWSANIDEDTGEMINAEWTK